LGPDFWFEILICAYKTALLLVRNCDSNVVCKENKPSAIVKQNAADFDFTVITIQIFCTINGWRI